jgi:hypothetical protein
MPEEIENARITATFFGIEDHGILTWVLTCERDSGTQGFGGWGFTHQPSGSKVIGQAMLAEQVYALLKTLEVDSWEKLKGLYVRTKREDGMIVAIGHIVKNKWLDLRAWKTK